MSVASVGGRRWRRWRHRRAGHSRLKLFLMQATCRRATPPLKVARQVHVTKRTTTTQKGAADGTQRNDEKGGKQIRELRRLFAGKILGALPCVQDAPGLWILPARMYIEHGPDASDTTASHTCGRSLQNHRRTRPGCYHSEESARISGIAMVITANEGGTLVAPKNRDLAHAA